MGQQEARRLSVSASSSSSENPLSIYKGKKVWLSGHTGFKGAWLAEWLLKLGAEVHGFSIDIPTKPSLFEALGLESRLKSHVFGDVENAKAVLESMKAAAPDFVFHLAAQPLVRLSYDEPLKTFATNVMGTAHVLEAMRACASVRAAVMITTDKVYEPHDEVFSFRESDRLGGNDPYSGSKAACELVIRSYYKSYFEREKARLGIGVVRAGNVIGGGDWSLDRLIPDAVRAWLKKEPLVIRSPEAVRPWQHVLEPLSGYLHLGAKLYSNSERFSGQAYNFAPEVERGGSVGEITTSFEGRWKGFEVKIDRGQTGTKKETKWLRLNYEKALIEMGWRPKLSLANALDWTASWYETYYADSKRARDFTDSQIDRYSELIKNREAISQ